MNRLWRVSAPHTLDCTQLSEELGLQPLTASVLAARGIITAKDAERFLSPVLADMPDPDIMTGMDSAVNRLLKARMTGELVSVYGDYDVDGITATALLLSFFRATGYRCSYFIPHRIDDGYGLNSDSLQAIRATGASLAVSVDCGITAVVEAQCCRDIGLDLIITDHHTPGAFVPDAAAVINPLQPGCSYPFKSLAGVGVAFNLLVALRRKMRLSGLFAAGEEPDMRRFLDLVALGTIADVVPLVGENRRYVCHGLKLLSSTARIGIEALKKVSAISGTVSCGQVGFRLAPRLNAAGRLESAVPGVELLLTEDHDEAARIASDLDAANGERRSIENSILEEALEMLGAASAAAYSRYSIVLASKKWHSGVVGIVASRLVERFNRPTVLIALDAEGKGKGSGRSIGGFHLLDALKVCASHLDRFGGHRHAAGVSVAADQVMSFADAFEEEAARRLSGEDLRPSLTIDAIASPGETTLELAEELQRLAPFGNGNPEPTFVMKGLKRADSRIVGEGHLKLRLERDGYRFQAIGFRMGERDVPHELDIAFMPEVNVWNGSSSLQLRLKDVRPTE